MQTEAILTSSWRYVLSVLFWLLYMLLFNPLIWLTYLSLIPKWCTILTLFCFLPSEAPALRGISGNRSLQMLHWMSIIDFTKRTQVSTYPFTASMAWPLTLISFPATYLYGHLYFWPHPHIWLNCRWWLCLACLSICSAMTWQELVGQEQTHYVRTLMGVLVTAAVARQVMTIILVTMGWEEEEGGERGGCKILCHLLLVWEQYDHYHKGRQSSLMKALCNPWYVLCCLICTVRLVYSVNGHVH